MYATGATGTIHYQVVTFHLAQWGGPHYRTRVNKTVLQFVKDAIVCCI